MRYPLDFERGKERSNYIYSTGDHDSSQTSSTTTEIPGPVRTGMVQDVGADTLVRYAPADLALTFFQLSLPSSDPSALTLDSAGNLWFTAGGSSGNYFGEMAP